MTRILPLIPILLWLFWSDPTSGAASDLTTDQAIANLMSLSSTPDRWFSLLWMAGGLLGIVAVMVVWARLLLYRHRHSFAPVPTRAFSFGMLGARILSVVWFGFALYELGFGQLISALMQPMDVLGIRLPGIVAATFPSLIGWVGLSWAAYPIDRAMREQNLLAEINAGLTPRAPPTLAQSLSTNFRMQVLFMLAPVLAVALLRDAITVGFHFTHVPPGGRAEGIAFVAASLIVFLASPELLIRVLRAQSLAPSPLRTRLEVLARRLDVRYRDILVWHTSYGIGNAAVMGLVPRFRYILLTDLLIETLDDAQIEAVFAHEAGHVKHRHLLWYVAFWAMFLLCIAGPGDALSNLTRPYLSLSNDAVTAIWWVVLFGGYLVLFGILSRLFERQADVFAARSIQSLHLPLADTSRARPLATPVGSIGAESFVSALCRVAEISHRPIIQRSRARNRLAGTVARAIDVTLNFSHPSIPERIDHLRELAMQPALTERFDRKVVLVMLAMLFALVTLSTWVLVTSVR